MILYHFTSAYHLKMILKSGMIRTTDSCLTPGLPNSAEVVKDPKVVWLTNDASWSHQNWRQGSLVDKAEVRIAVELPRDNVYKWLRWAKQHGAPERWIKALINNGGGLAEANHWYVCEDPVPSFRWRKIELRSGERLARSRHTPSEGGTAT